MSDEIESLCHILNNGIAFSDTETDSQKLSGHLNYSNHTDTCDRDPPDVVANSTFDRMSTSCIISDFNFLSSGTANHHKRTLNHGGDPSEPDIVIHGAQLCTNNTDTGEVTSGVDDTVTSNHDPERSCHTTNTDRAYFVDLSCLNTSQYTASRRPWSSGGRMSSSSLMLENPRQQTRRANSRYMYFDMSSSAVAASTATAGANRRTSTTGCARDATSSGRPGQDSKMSRADVSTRRARNRSLGHASGDSSQLKNGAHLRRMSVQLQSVRPATRDVRPASLTSPNTSPTSAPSARSARLRGESSAANKAEGDAKTRRFLRAHTGHGAMSRSLNSGSTSTKTSPQNVSSPGRSEPQPRAVNNSSDILSIKSRKADPSRSNHQDISSSVSESVQLHRKCSDTGSNKTYDVISLSNNTALPAEHYSLTLPNDLLTLLNEGLFADFYIWVKNDKFSVHKSILSARCQYFRNYFLSSSSSTLYLNNYLRSTVEFALTFIYTDCREIPDDVDLGDLLALAASWKFDVLLHLIELCIRVRLCHMFHKPCHLCIPGALESLRLAVQYGLDDLRDRCLLWIGHHRTTIWSHHTFASLEPSLLDLCLVTDRLITFETVFDFLLDCAKLLRSTTCYEEMNCNEESDMSASSGVFYRRLLRLQSEAVVFVSRNLVSLLTSDRLISLMDSSNGALLYDYLLAAAEMQNGADALTCLELIREGGRSLGGNHLDSVDNAYSSPMTTKVSPNSCNNVSTIWKPEFKRLLVQLAEICSKRVSSSQNYTTYCLHNSLIGCISPTSAGSAGSARATTQYLHSPQIKRKPCINSSNGEKKPMAYTGQQSLDSSSSASGCEHSPVIDALFLSRDECPSVMARSESFTIVKQESGTQ